MTYIFISWDNDMGNYIVIHAIAFQTLFHAMYWYQDPLQ